MNITITGRRLEVTPSLRDYAETLTRSLMRAPLCAWKRSTIYSRCL